MLQTVVVGEGCLWVGGSEARGCGGTRMVMHSLGLGRDQGTPGACTAIWAGTWAGTSRSTLVMGSASQKRRLIQGEDAAGLLHEDALLRASPVAAQDLRPLPVPGGEHGRAG